MLWLMPTETRPTPFILPFLRASSAVQNGLLVLNLLINDHKGLAEQLGKCGLHAVLQSCCHAGQSSNKMLAQMVLSRLAEHKVLLNQESAGMKYPPCRFILILLQKTNYPITTNVSELSFLLGTQLVISRECHCHSHRYFRAISSICSSFCHLSSYNF